MYLPTHNTGALSPPHTSVMRSGFDKWKLHGKSEKPVYNDPRHKPCKLQFTDLCKLIRLSDNLPVNTIAKSINRDGTNWHPICNRSRRSNKYRDWIYLPTSQVILSKQFKGLCLKAEPRKFCHSYPKSQPPWEVTLLTWSWSKKYHF